MAGSDSGDDTGDTLPEAPPADPEAIAARIARDDAQLTPAERFRRGTTAGALGAALAMGMAKVFDPVKVDQVTVEQEAPSQPLDEKGVELRFHPESARDTVAVVRGPRPAGGSEADADAGDDS